MKLAKVLVWGAGLVAVVVFTDVWHRHFGTFDWGAFQSARLLKQVLLPAVGIGAIFAVTIWIAGRQR